MGHRLSVIATRSGDGGTTGLADGSRLPKHSPRIAALGDVDELNSTLGMLLAEPLPAPMAEALLAAQHELFDLGGELALPGRQGIGPEAVARLDARLADWNAELPPLREFVLPGGCRAAALAHVARAVCRRAERALVALAAAETEAVGMPARQYLNRLSDLLFVAARRLNREAGRPDVFWRNPGPRGAGQAEPG